LLDLGAALVQAGQMERAKKIWTETETVIDSIDDSGARAFLLHELGEALVQTQQLEQAQVMWARAEILIRTLKEDRLTKSLVVRMMAKVMAQAEQWEQAEVLIRTLKESDERTWALDGLVEALGEISEREQLHVVQHLWLHVSTREYAIELLPLAQGLIPLKPAIGIAFYEAFTWVDTFLMDV